MPSGMGRNVSLMVLVRDASASAVLVSVIWSQHESIRPKRKLPAMVTGIGRIFEVLIDREFRRNPLGRIAIVCRETVQHLFVPRPVLQHSDGASTKSRGTLVPEKETKFARQDGVHRMAKLMEQRPRNRGRARTGGQRRRREIAHERNDRALIRPIGVALAVK